MDTREALRDRGRLSGSARFGRSLAMVPVAMSAPSRFLTRIGQGGPERGVHSSECPGVGPGGARITVFHARR